MKIVSMWKLHLKNGRFLNRLSLQSAISQATDAKTCKLGNMFVEVSIVYKILTAHLKILSDSMTGLKSCPFG